MRSLVWPLKTIPPTLSTNFRWLVISLVSFLLLWGTVSLLMNEPTLLPTPWEVFIGFFNLIKDGQLLTDIQASLQRVFIGFFIASCLAVPLGIILAYFYIPRQILLPIITILRPIPPIAWIPLAILWFGIGDSSSYFITALAAFFPIFINSFAGGKAVEHQHISETELDSIKLPRQLLI